MRIEQIVCVPVRTGFYTDDQRAIKAGASIDGFFYQGEPLTEGFSSIRMPGEAISIMLLLSGQRVATGDCAAVQYSGAGGRDPFFEANRYIPMIQEHVIPQLLGRNVDSFRETTALLDSIRVGEGPLHTAVRYGFSQALLEASSMAHDEPMAIRVCREYGLQVDPTPVPLFGQSGDDRYTAVDKMILKEVDALPHGLINSIPKKLGYRGELLKEYIRWIAQRVRSFRRQESYLPDIHVDVYGTIGLMVEDDLDQVVEYLAGLQQDAGEFTLYIEGPVDMGQRDRQIEAMSHLTTKLRELGSPVRIVADEWCNTKEDIIEFTDAKACHMVQIKTPDLGSLHHTIESVLYCNGAGMEAYQGGTCNETDLSARCCVHTALATRPKRLLVKPGMGFDEGLTIVGNEMARTCALMGRYAI